MSKVAIFSDLHLGLYGNSELWHNVALNWADWIVGDLKSKGIDTIFFLGDLFHQRDEISVQTIHVASELIQKFKDFDMTIIVGNHDAYYKNRADIHSLGFLKGHENITVVDEAQTVTRNGVKVAMVPWNTPIPDGKYDYVFGHFEIQTFKMNDYKVCNHGDSPSEMLKKSSRIFSGHFHTKSLKQYKEGEIRYVGNCFAHDFNDEGDPKGYHILDIVTGELVFVENPVSPKFVRMRLSKLASLQKEDVFGNVFKLIIDKEIDDIKLAKVKDTIAKMKPFRFDHEYDIVSTNNSKIESVDSLDIPEMFEEFYSKIEISEEQCERVRKINEELYERNR
jgi:DNA repair exonuclease SbcCD nuclease subunit